MYKKLPTLLFAIIILTSCSKNTILQKAESLLAPNEPKIVLKFNFEEEMNELGHLAQPWAVNKYTGKGSFSIGKSTFLKEDTLLNSRGKSYTSKTDYRNNTLLYLDYGDNELLPLTEELYFEKLINTARYSPQIVMEEFIKRSKEFQYESDKSVATYAMKMGKYSVKLRVNLTTQRVSEISYLSYDELYGDVITKFKYSGYKASNKIEYPTEVQIEKVNGKVIDMVNVFSVAPDTKDVKLLEKPKDYALVASPSAILAKLKTTKYNEHISFIDLEHTDDKVMVVEFDDYMLVAEAPINSKNGELIISEVRKIAPSKPIKYFVFGHHHPHYLGGLRAFVHKESTILCTEMSKDYVEYIASAPHKLQADSLELEPKKLKTQVIRDSLSISNGTEMKIYFIGEKSAHTYDYLIYYFPKYKLLFQDDLCWIPDEGPITKAGSRQLGLYNSILELNLNVDTIIQSWPVQDYKVKTVIPFADLKESVLLK